MNYIIYTCSCGNYVAEPTVNNVHGKQAGRFRLGGSVYCTASSHGAVQPEMRRVAVGRLDDDELPPTSTP